MPSLWDAITASNQPGMPQQVQSQPVAPPVSQTNALAATSPQRDAQIHDDPDALLTRLKQWSRANFGVPSTPDQKAQDAEDQKNLDSQIKMMKQSWDASASIGKPLSDADKRDMMNTITGSFRYGQKMSRDEDYQNQKSDREYRTKTYPAYIKVLQDHKNAGKPLDSWEQRELDEWNSSNTKK